MIPNWLRAAYAVRFEDWRIAKANVTTVNRAITDPDLHRRREARLTTWKQRFGEIRKTGQRVAAPNNHSSIDLKTRDGTCRVVAASRGVVVMGDYHAPAIS